MKDLTRECGHEPMTAERLTRRNLLRTSLITAVGLSGCTAGNDGSGTDSSPTPTGTETTTPTTTTDDGTTEVASLSVSDFILYPLAGTHPHVHRRANTQYVVVRLDSSFSPETLRERLTLELDGGSVPLADRQPVPWQHDTIDLAFAVGKGDTYESGRVFFDQTKLHSLSQATLDRLNNPPVFEVAEPSVSPRDVRVGEKIEATVEFSVSNTGDGRGQFGASLKGNFVSGSKTLTATVDAGAERSITGTTRLVGEGDAATIRLDWGSGEWTTDIPVVGTPTESATPTQTPAPQ